VEKDAVPTAQGATARSQARAHPVEVNTQLDPKLIRWLWLVKWLLAIPPLHDLGLHHPHRLSRGLVFLKWWLLAIPHSLGTPA
jgi:hypothetical protein